MIAHTIESIQKRCIEVGDCLEWSGAKTNGHPTLRHAGKTWLVRRLVAALAGMPVTPEKKAVTSCENLLCVNPDHIVLRSHVQVMKRQGELGKLSDLARIAKIAATKRAKYAKLTMDDARSIRASNDTHQKTAQRYGIHPSKVAAIRQHRCWRELSGNPFSGLGGRA